MTRTAEGVAGEHSLEAPATGRRRVVIESMSPLIDGGEFPVKRVVGEQVRVEADIFTDGHDSVSAQMLHRREGARDWREVRMRPLVNDRWTASFPVESVGAYEFTIVGWIDRFATWRRDMKKRLDADQDVAVDLLVGAGLVVEAADQATGEVERSLRTFARRLEAQNADARAAALDSELAELMRKHAPRLHAASHDRVGKVWVDRERARFSAWYEFFPRSVVEGEERHGTFRDCVERLPYVREMGFDVVYLPPIHPIGRTHRKGRNNKRTASPGDVGSPWAIGAPEGGHKSVHPELGTLEDFRNLVREARAHNLEIALDIALQCSPDHPYVHEHPEWFKMRPDGTIQHAENPPKKYEDIYPFDFECSAWRELWDELKSIFLFWIEQGVRIFRVDNPHTKPFAFWQWLISEVKAEEPDALFLAEAFTRPKVMHRLAKLGFTQSYTYFAWRNSKWELTEYFTELTQTKSAEYFRPNAWPNTPDILTEHLQFGGRPVFIARAALAATLAASYGVYGPAFELLAAEPREPGSEEYRDSEKYEIRRWNLDDPDSIREHLALLNRARREHPALQSNDNLVFHRVENDQIICYSKATDDRSDVILCVVNLDPHHRQSGMIDLDLDAIGVDHESAFQVHDLLGGGRYIWQGPRNYIDLDPNALPAHVFHVKRRMRTERSFDYFM